MSGVASIPLTDTCYGEAFYSRYSDHPEIPVRIVGCYVSNDNTPWLIAVDRDLTNRRFYYDVMGRFRLADPRE